MVLVNVKGFEYSIDGKLIPKWDTIKDGKLAKKDEDRCYVVDGRERSGKSLFTIQQAAYIDPTIIEGNLDRITFSGEETIRAIQNTDSNIHHTKVIIFDEAFRGLSSRSVLSKTNKMIVQALMEMGQKNLVLFIVLPSFFMLDRYPAMMRTNALFHIRKEKNSNVRTFGVYPYGVKAKLYNEGMKKGWSYPIPTRVIGKFFNKYPGGKEFEDKYRAKKLAALQSMGITTEKITEESRMSRERKILLVLFYSYFKFVKKDTTINFLEWLRSVGIEMSIDNIRQVAMELRKSGIKMKSELLKQLYSNSLQGKSLIEGWVEQEHAPIRGWKRFEGIQEDEDALKELDEDGQGIEEADQPAISIPKASKHDGIAN